MAATLGVPEALRERVSTFVSERALAVEVVAAGGDCAVSVVEAGEREQGDERTLRVGGWISCQSARAMAGKLRLDGRKIGKLCDLLDVKIRDCELGCFE